MIAITDLHRTAREYLRAARLLRNRNSYDAAVYVCGYAVEIALKARICQALHWTTGFPQTGVEFQEKDALLKTHNFQVLLEYTTVQDRVRSTFLPEWSIIIEWTPEQRYSPIGTKALADANRMIAATQTLLRVLL